MHKGLAVVTGLLLVAAPAMAGAQERCEGGEWFCDEPTQGTDNATSDESQDESQADSADSEDAAEGSDSEEPAEPSPPPERSRKIHVETARPKPPRRHYRRHEWGLNLHLLGALMGDNPAKNSSAGMGGLGLELRYRTVPHFAFTVGADFVGGTDWNGDRRTEDALLFGGIIFFNPRSRLQLYMPLGLGFSGAAVTMPAADGVDEHKTRYSYFGAYIGFGGELRVARRVALDLDLLGFARTRTDVREGDAPEYVDPNTGLTTNSSGGGLVRGGITFYW